MAPLGKFSFRFDVKSTVDTEDVLQSRGDAFPNWSARGWLGVRASIAMNFQHVHNRVRTRGDDEGRVRSYNTLSFRERLSQCRKKASLPEGMQKAFDLIEQQKPWFQFSDLLIPFGCFRSHQEIC